ncbi:hypothetical protein CSB09_04455 [Candidatus Gracilibacteria bacterium]|nr:MAG: hypothetical protein CSB09_04455 [Candidatus Gracilibacteria bacterium]
MKKHASKKTRQAKNSQKHITAHSKLWKILSIIILILVSIVLGIIASVIFVGVFFPNPGLAGMTLIALLLPILATLIGIGISQLYSIIFGKKKTSKKGNLNLQKILASSKKIIIYVIVNTLLFFVFVFLLKNGEHFGYFVGIFLVLVSNIYIHKYVFSKKQ